MTPQARPIHPDSHPQHQTPQSTCDSLSWKRRHRRVPGHGRGPQTFNILGIVSSGHPACRLPTQPKGQVAVSPRQVSRQGSRRALLVVKQSLLQILKIRLTLFIECPPGVIVSVPPSLTPPGSQHTGFIHLLALSTAPRLSPGCLRAGTALGHPVSRACTEPST